MSGTSAITTHVLDTSRGRPAAGVAVTLARKNADGAWSDVASGRTNDDGRVSDLLEPGKLAAGCYRLAFDTRAYFDASGTATFYPEVVVTFDVADASQHYHVPVLLSPFGYTTYRGS